MSVYFWHMYGNIWSWYCNGLWFGTYVHNCWVCILIQNESGMTYICNLAAVFPQWYIPITWNVICEVYVQCSWSWLMPVTSCSTYMHTILARPYVPEKYGKYVKCCEHIWFWLDTMHLSWKVFVLKEDKPGCQLITTWQIMVCGLIRWLTWYDIAALMVL